MHSVSQSPRPSPRPAAGLIATGLVAAGLTAAGLFATGLLAAGAARAAEPFDAACDNEPGRGQPIPLIINGFKTGSAAVPADQQNDIRRYAETLTPYSKICVVGQADKRGPSDMNDHLAMNRARAVAAHLIGAGIAPENLSLSSRAEAFGDAAPDWFWFNGSRRVEVIALQ
jgi:outer membrane protein OmpA-like peptidoglycan-associated protein